jgi:aspartate racemase
MMPAMESHAPTPVGDRVVGIVGGTGPESTIDYYRRLGASWRRRRPDGTYPRIIIDSVDGGSVIQWLGNGEYAAVGRAFGSALGELAAAGCGLGLIASNACHLAFDYIDPPSPIGLIHIVDAARDHAIATGRRRLGIIGTRYVMQAPLYPDRFEPFGIDIVAPSLDEQDTVHRIYFDELVPGVVRDDSRRQLVAVVEAMRDRDGIDGIVLAGTELALILTEPAYAGVPVLDTAGIHVEAAVDWLLGETTSFE